MNTLRINDFGFQIIEGIKVIDNENRVQEKVILDDLQNINIRFKSNLSFTDVSIEKDFEIVFTDLINKNISGGVLNFDDNNDNNIEEIIDKLYNHKTFYKLSVIIYNEYSSKIETVLKALKAGNETPQTVFLVNTAPNDSNTENCVFDKTELGQKAFYDLLVEACEKHVGLQFNNQEELMNAIDTYINTQIGIESKVAITNAVGINFYNFTEVVIDEGYLNRYGYYVNTVSKDVINLVDKVRTVGESKNNSIHDKVQFDIDTPFAIYFDISDCLEYDDEENPIISLNNEVFTEKDDKEFAMSLTHLDNIFWKYIVGIEEVQVNNNILNKNKYNVQFLSEKEDKFELGVNSNFSLDLKYRGLNTLNLNIKNRNGITHTFPFEFIVDYKEPEIESFTLNTTDKITETGYTGKKELEYTKDNFFEVGIRLNGEYDFYDKGYKLLIFHKNNPDYKIERILSEKFISKTYTFHIDDIKNEKIPGDKIKFGEWECHLIRIDYDYAIRKTSFNIVSTIGDTLELIAEPVSPDYEDFENNGLQQGKDIYVRAFYKTSTYFKKLRDFLYFCKEVKFIVNNINFTIEPEYFTYNHLVSLDSISSHVKVSDVDERPEMRWFISGSSEGASNEYLNPIANLEGNEKKIKKIRVQFILYDNNKIIETNVVTVGETGKVTAPILLGSDRHFTKLKLIEAKNLGISVNELTPEQIASVEEKMNHLAELNYSNQQIINNTRTFVFYSYLAELQFDFGICEYYTVTQNDNTTDLIPITRDGKIRYVLEADGIDENSKTRLTVKGYVKLADGKTISSEEVSIDMYRKKYPSLINTGNDYTRYMLYKEENGYFKLQTLLQSKIELDNLNGIYSSEWMKYIKVDLVDIDKRTVVVSAPNVVFYDGFIPQTVVFDTGITQEQLNSLKEDERFELSQAVQYKEIEKILNEKIFSKGKHLGQTFYLRFTGIESYLDAFGIHKEIKGKDTFYPINFEEALKGIKIAPSSGVIIVNENDNESYYTYKNKVNFVVESNNAEYYMYRTDRTAAFQKIYPLSIGTSKIVRLTMSTYEIGNHILEIKQQALGETESNVYSVIVEKIDNPTPPKLTGYDVTDENPEWTLYPVDSAEKYNTYIISDEIEHSKKTLNKLQYEIKVEPEKYLENGYHILVAESVDKIGNLSDESFYITRKISTPVCSTIEGVSKTSEDVIIWKWLTQYNEGVRNYEIEINGIDKITVPATTSGFNEYHLRFFQGKPLQDGVYEIRVWAVNELGHKSFKYSSFVTEKGSKIKEIIVEFYKYKDDYTNKLEAKVLKRDNSVKSIEYQIFHNNNGILTECTDIMSTDNNELLFLDKNGIKLQLEDGTYYFAFRGVNYIGEKTEFVKTPFIYKTTLPEKPFIYYQKSVKTANPIFFIKETGTEMIEAIEIKIGEHSFEKIRNNAWRPNYSLEKGINNIVFRITDYAGNISEYTDFIEVTPSGINLFQESYKVDMNNPVVKLDFNLPQMSNFGHTHFRIEQINLGIDVIVDIKNANNLEIPLTSDNKVFPDGIYTFSVKLFDSLTNDYDYIADYFAITIDSNKPLKPYFLNNGYDNIEFNKNYTKNRSPKWIWQTKDIANLKEYIIDLYIYDEKENNYVEYGNKQFNNYSTNLSGQFQSTDEFKDGTYKLSVKAIGNNNLSSDSESFIFVIKNSLPNPPHFDTSKMINRKYESKNTGITWIWEDLNVGNDILVGYKIKINDEEFSDEFEGNINYYKETRTLPDGPNKITVIGRDKAGNWSSANEINANNLGKDYLYNIKIIDTKAPNNLTEEDIKIRILDSRSFETFFQNDDKDDEYFLFELFTLNQNKEEILFVKGNTLPLGTTNVYFEEKELTPGIELGEYDDETKTGYCTIRDNTTEENGKYDKSLYFTNLPNNIYYLRVHGIDYSGNISKGLVKEIEMQDLTKLCPQFILPKEFYTNNSTIIFQWILNQPNIKGWEYQLVTPYNNSIADLASEEKWKSLDNNMFTLNNIPKIIAGNDADGDYTFYVRAVFDELVIQEDTGKEVNKKSDISSVTVNLDRKLPQGIIFTNKAYTTDQSVLKWSWNYTGEGDTANGVYVSFNPNIPIEEWEKLEATTTYSSFKERQDGIYTLYVRTFDKAGNINSTIFENSITLDRIPPFKPIINGGSHIYTNIIPTIRWEVDNNYFKFAWAVLELDEWNVFKKIYDKLVNIENYTLTNDDWAYIFSKNRDSINLENVHEDLKTAPIDIDPNDFLIENEITINSTAEKHGISAEGEYVFLLSGFDQNNNWAEEFEYQFITYDITAPNVALMKFTYPKYTITNERRPRWEWTVPFDVTRCEYSMEKNGYDDGSMKGTLTKPLDKDVSSLTYSFTPSYNLTKGNYRLLVNCYDSANNYVQITKSVIIEDSSSELENEFFDIVLPGMNNILRCKMNKYSDVYVIVDATIDKNSVLTYRKSIDIRSGYKIYTFGKDELDLKESYDFKLTTYNIKTN